MDHLASQAVAAVVAIAILVLAVWVIGRLTAFPSTITVHVRHTFIDLNNADPLYSFDPAFFGEDDGKKRARGPDAEKEVPDRGGCGCSGCTCDSAGGSIPERPFGVR